MQPSSLRNLVATVTFGFLSLGASTASRVDYPPPPPSSEFGGYCDATTSDGVWAFTFGRANQYDQCDQVREVLYNITAAPIIGMRQGDYRLNGYNYVTATCSHVNTSFNGIGGQPLEAAYQYAVSTGDSFCLFTVQ